LLKYNALDVSMNEHITYYTHYAYNSSYMYDYNVYLLQLYYSNLLLTTYVHFKLQAFQNIKCLRKQEPVIKVVSFEQRHSLYFCGQ